MSQHGNVDGESDSSVQRRILARSTTLLECEAKLGSGIGGIEYAERAVRGLLVNKDSSMTQPVERSALLDSLADFLPKLQKANEEVKLARENFPWMDTTMSPAVVADNAKKRARAEIEPCESVTVPIPLRPGVEAPEFDALVQAQRETYGAESQHDVPAVASEGLEPTEHADAYTIPDDPAIVGAFRGTAPPGVNMAVGNGIPFLAPPRSIMQSSMSTDPALMDPAILSVGARPNVEVDVYIPQHVASEYERSVQQQHHYPGYYTGSDHYHTQHRHHQQHHDQQHPSYHPQRYHPQYPPQEYTTHWNANNVQYTGQRSGDTKDKQKGKKARSFCPTAHAHFVFE